MDTASIDRKPSGSNTYGITVKVGAGLAMVAKITPTLALQKGSASFTGEIIITEIERE